MENLKVFSMKNDIERVLNAFEVPAYAKLHIVKEIQAELEKQYIQKVQEEFQENQRQVKEAKAVQEKAESESEPIE